MRREQLVDLFGAPIPGTDTVSLSTRERATLLRAARILHAYRILVEPLDEDTATDVALAAYTCEDIAQ